VAPVTKEAPRCLTGAGLKSGSRVEFVARSEAGDDGRLQSRRPGTGATRKAAFPEPLALGVLVSRLKEAARVASGGRLEAADRFLRPCDRRRSRGGRSPWTARPPELRRTPHIARRGGRLALRAFRFPKGHRRRRRRVTSSGEPGDTWSRWRSLGAHPEGRAYLVFLVASFVSRSSISSLTEIAGRVVRGGARGRGAAR
jgi:hypothetical protein